MYAGPMPPGVRGAQAGIVSIFLSCRDTYLLKVRVMAFCGMKSKGFLEEI